MLLATELVREFVFNEKQTEIILNDPDTGWTPEDVMNFYANVYPSLTTAKISGPVIVEDKLQYQFKSIMGTKG